MNNKKLVIFTSSTILTCSLALGSSYYMGKLVYNGSVGSEQTVKNEEMLAVYSSRANKPLKVLEKYKYTDLMIERPQNKYNIEAKLFEATSKTENTIVLVHGIGSNYNEYLLYAQEYLNNGFNVMLYNQRNTGLSGGNNYTFGLYEKHDLDAVTKYVSKQYPDGKLGVQGFSMGAATAAMHSKINETHKIVDFYILEGPYSDMNDAIDLGIKAENIPLIPISYIRFWGNIYNKRHAGFEYNDVKPAQEVKSITTPMMIIYGEKDTVCAPENSIEIYENIPHSKKELWEIKNSGHVEGWKDTGDEYFKRIFKFISKYSIN
ncbi:MAG: alpha/beta hydrolase [Sarcina sp.]